MDIGDEIEGRDHIGDDDAVCKWAMQDANIKESLGEDDECGFVFESENGILEGRVMAVRVANYLRQRYECTVGQFQGDEQYPADPNKWIVKVKLK